MTYVVVLVALVCLAVSHYAWSSIYRAQIREHARERNLMLNQLMHLAGRTWEQPPDAQQWAPPAEPDELYEEPFLADPSFGG